MRTSASARWVAAVLLGWLAISDGFLPAAVGQGHNYREALSKSILFLEAQRSGRLPKNSRVGWRGDSGINDGMTQNVDLVGGYYDAGDNVKYGLPMAFTVTTLAWAALSYNSELRAAGELENLKAAIRWGTDYFLKASAKRNRLWVQVGDPVADHECWVRPENMQTPRTLYMIDEKTPGTEIAAETAAAMAASSIVFRPDDRKYARSLLNKAKLLFEFAKSHKGTYDGECPFYCSFSGYNDELLWAATWLYIATRKDTYRKFITEEAISSSVAEFSWDLKYAGAQILLSGLLFNGEKGLEEFKVQADNFVCAVLPDSPYKQVYISPGGMIHLRDGANTQYVTSAAFLLSMDYLLGSNPLKRSYMVGFGNNSPKQPHHRGSSVPPQMPNGALVNCAMSFVHWFKPNIPNPNELTGAIVGGPDRNDNFDDQRWDSSKLEPTTYINSIAVGVLAKLAAQSK
ncbi:hypothetical protein Taro_006009 [Colocasia esculenta]|uniref:Endoglucanase n=1 Tax=Colocasia esculenta TaxID=4460 RepID=A0A843TVX3_COLES|nr:hypothetical protein [Colocasia esculenta]